MRFVLLALALAGCGAADPCDGIQGTCLSATVEGDVKMLDALEVSVDNLPQPMRSMPGGTFDLPVRLAIVLPASLGASAVVTIDGYAAGQRRGSTGRVPVTLTPNGKSSQTFHLTAAGGGDGGVGDAGDGGPPPGVVSFNPPVLDFGPVQRGKTSMVLKTTIVNNTTQTVSLGGMPTDSGDQMFQFDLPSNTCLVVGDGGMSMSFLPLAPGKSCTLGFTFQPTRSIAAQSMTTLPFDDGEMVTFTMKGQGLRAWSGESVTGSPNLNGVWGSGANDIWVTAALMGPGAEVIFHRNSQDGSWSGASGGLSANVYDIKGASANAIWAAGAGGIIYFSNGTPNWSPLMGPTTSPSIQGLYARDPTHVFGVGDNTTTLYTCGTSGTCISLYTPATSSQFRGMCGSGNRMVMVGTAGQWFYSNVDGTSFFMANAVPGGNPDLSACWMPNDQEVWIVGSAPVGGTGAGTIMHCKGANLDMCSAEVPGTNGNLTDIGGWHNPATNKLELYIVGGLGNQILANDGTMGQWTVISNLPNNQAMNAVWVSPIDGEVVAAGFSGQINHFY